MGDSLGTQRCNHEIGAVIRHRHQQSSDSDEQRKRQREWQQLVRGRRNLLHTVCPPRQTPANPGDDPTADTDGQAHLATGVRWGPL